jgi:hypothetical protein
MSGPHSLSADTQSAHIWARPAIGQGEHSGHIWTLAIATTYTAFCWHASCTILCGGIETTRRKGWNDVVCRLEITNAAC